MASRASGYLLEQYCDFTSSMVLPDSKRLQIITKMCTQVDKKWACGHYSFFKINFCKELFKGCKGTSSVHDTVTSDEICSDCERRESLPEPYEAR